MTKQKTPWEKEQEKMKKAVNEAKKNLKFR